MKIDLKYTFKAYNGKPMMQRQEDESMASLTSKEALCVILSHTYESDKGMTRMKALERQQLVNQIYATEGEFDFNTEQLKLIDSLLEKAVGVLYAFPVISQLYDLTEVKTEKPDLKLLDNEKKD